MNYGEGKNGLNADIVFNEGEKNTQRERGQNGLRGRDNEKNIVFHPRPSILWTRVDNGIEGKRACVWVLLLF